MSDQKQQEQESFSYEEWAKSVPPQYELTPEQVAKVHELYQPVADYLLTNNIPANFTFIEMQHPSGVSRYNGVLTAVGMASYTSELLALHILATGGLHELDLHYDTLLEAHNDRIINLRPRIVTK